MEAEWKGELYHSILYDCKSVCCYKDVNFKMKLTLKLIGPDKSGYQVNIFLIST